MKKSRMQKDFSLKSKLQRFAEGGMTNFEHRQEANDNLAFTEQAHGGPIHGPGGPTEDKVGPVMLSDGEYVLPADTVKAIGKENLDRLRAATHRRGQTTAENGVPHAAGGYYSQAKDYLADKYQKLRAPRPGVDPGVVSDDAYLKQASKGLQAGTASEGEFAVAAGRAAPALPQSGLARRALGAAGKLAAPVALGASAVQTAGTSTQNYRDRLGIQLQPGEEASVAGDLGVRTLGAGTDLLNTALFGSLDPLFADKQAGAPTLGLPAAEASAGAPSVQAPGGVPGVSTLRSQNIVQSPGRFGERSFKREGEDFQQGLSVVPYAEGTAALERANAIDRARIDSEAVDPDSQITIVGRQGPDYDKLFGKKLPDRFANANRLRGQAISSFEQDQRQEALTRRGQDITARGQDLELLMGSSRLRQDAAKSDRDFALELRKLSNSEGKDKATNLAGAFDKMFQMKDEKGDYKPDTVKQEAFKDFLFRADPRFKGLSRAQAERALVELEPYELAQVLSIGKIQFEQNTSMNASQNANLFGGSVSDRYDPAANVRESNFGDVMRGGLPVRKYLYSNLPFTDPNVVETQSGRVGLRSEYTSTGGTTDLGKQTELDEQVNNAKKRKLRRD